MLRVRVYRDGRPTEEDVPVERLGELSRDSSVVVWVDIPTPDEALIQSLQDQLGFHRLAVEDVLSERQRPKLESYGDRFFLSTYAIHLQAGSEEPGDIRIASTEISAFISSNMLVVVPGGDGFDADEVLRRADENSALSPSGSGFLLYSLLDYVVDSQLAAAEALDERADDLGQMLFERRPRHIQMESFALQKELTRLRRLIVPMREVLSAVLRHESTVHHGGNGNGGGQDQRGGAGGNGHSDGNGNGHSDAHDDGGRAGPRRRTDDAEGSTLSTAGQGELQPYFQDVQDHLLRAIDWTESARDMVSTVLQTHLTMQGNTMNIIMKKVTSWAAIIAVPTAITGFYGMNVPYPGFNQPWGVPVAVGVMIVASVALWRSFKKRDWL